MEARRSSYWPREQARDLVGEIFRIPQAAHASGTGAATSSGEIAQELDRHDVIVRADVKGADLAGRASSRRCEGGPRVVRLTVGDHHNLRWLRYPARDQVEREVNGGAAFRLRQLQAPGARLD